MFCGPNGWCKTGHNDWFTFIFLWVLPNTPWIFIPTALGIKFGAEIKKNLHVAAKVAQGAAKGAAARKAKTH
jgi:adiponectin receptor